jgi:hypothetical protein
MADIDLERRPRRPHPLALLALLLGAAGLLLLFLAGPGSRFGWWHFSTGFKLMTWAAYLGIAAVALAVLALALGRRRALVAAILALVLGARRVPPLELAAGGPRLPAHPRRHHRRRATPPRSWPCSRSARTRPTRRSTWATPSRRSSARRTPT